jgi:hypothetical protein
VIGVDAAIDRRRAVDMAPWLLADAQEVCERLQHIWADMAYRGQHLRHDSLPRSAGLDLCRSLYSALSFESMAIPSG